MIVGIAVAVTVASIDASTITSSSAAVVQRRGPVSMPPTPPEDAGADEVVFVSVGEDVLAKMHLGEFCARGTL